MDFGELIKSADFAEISTALGRRDIPHRMVFILPYGVRRADLTAEQEEVILSKFDGILESKRVPEGSND